MMDGITPLYIYKAHAKVLWNFSRIKGPIWFVFVNIEDRPLFYPALVDVYPELPCSIWNRPECKWVACPA